MEQAYTLELYIGQPAERVWSALTGKALVDTYYLAPLRSLDLRVGGAIAYGVSDDYIAGRITVCSAPTRLAHTFRFASLRDPETEVSYDIKAVGTGMCRLRIEHRGFPGRNETFAWISEGWPMIASSLKTVLETGGRLPWPAG